MPEVLTFMMGKFPAVLPDDFRYARNHMWCREFSSGLRFGFTSYAIRLMQDVYFLDWQVNPGDSVALSAQIGHIETSKAVADLFAPVAGTIISFNQDLLNDPSPINIDNYGAGWLFEMKADVGATMSVTEYHAFLAANWEKTQRTIKGHL